MGYLNPVEAMGFETFAKLAIEAGVDGVLTVDMPPEEGGGYTDVLAEQGLDRVFLVSPTTPLSRLAAVSEKGSGFVYYVSLKGVTGSGQLDVADVKAHVEKLQQPISLPIGIGFGIRDAQSAYAMAKLGDAVIIGSALVKLVEENQDQGLAVIQQSISQQMRLFRQALDKADQGEEL
jgi:tryptophan synthase alpha chain